MARSSAPVDARPSAIFAMPPSGRSGCRTRRSARPATVAMGVLSSCAAASSRAYLAASASRKDRRRLLLAGQRLLEGGPGRLARRGRRGSAYLHAQVARSRLAEGRDAGFDGEIVAIAAAETAHGRRAAPSSASSRSDDRSGQSSGWTNAAMVCPSMSSGSKDSVVRVDGEAKVTRPAPSVAMTTSAALSAMSR